MNQQAQLQRAEYNHAVAVAQANRNTEIERTAAEQARVAAVAAAQREATLKINAEAVKREAGIHRHSRNADH